MTWVLLAIVVIIFVCILRSGASETYTTASDMYSRFVGMWTNFPDNSPNPPSASDTVYTLVVNPDHSLDTTGLSVGPQIWGVLNISTGSTSQTLNFTKQNITETDTNIFLHLYTDDTHFYTLMVPIDFNPYSATAQTGSLFFPKTNFDNVTVTFSHF